MYVRKIGSLRELFKIGTLMFDRMKHLDVSACKEFSAFGIANIEHLMKNLHITRGIHCGTG